MGKLIDADDMIKSLMDRALYDDEGYPILDYEEKMSTVKNFVNSFPTVEAVPVSYIQQRIDRLRILAEYEAEANGGYIGRSYMAKFELEELIKYWKAEREQNDS